MNECIEPINTSHFLKLSLIHIRSTSLLEAFKVLSLIIKSINLLKAKNVVTIIRLNIIHQVWQLCHLRTKTERLGRDTHIKLAQQANQLTRLEGKSAIWKGLSLKRLQALLFPFERRLDGCASHLHRWPRLVLLPAKKETACCLARNWSTQSVGHSRSTRAHTVEQ